MYAHTYNELHRTSLYTDFLINQLEIYIVTYVYSYAVIQIYEFI